MTGAAAQALAAPSPAVWARWRWYPLLHILLFQIGWTVCVAGAAHGHLLAGPIAAALLTALHLTLMRTWRADCLLIGAALILGWGADSLLGWIAIERCAPFTSPWAPAWMVSLWGLFAATLHTYGRWLDGRPLLAAGVGALGGPLAYGAALRIGAVRVPDGYGTAMAAIALLWAICTPLLVALAAWSVRYAPAAEPRP